MQTTLLTNPTTISNTKTTKTTDNISLAKAKLINKPKQHQAISTKQNNNQVNTQNNRQQSKQKTYPTLQTRINKQTNHTSYNNKSTKHTNNQLKPTTHQPRKQSNKTSTRQQPFKNKPHH